MVQKAPLDQLVDDAKKLTHMAEDFEMALRGVPAAYHRELARNAAKCSQQARIVFLTLIGIREQTTGIESKLI